MRGFEAELIEHVQEGLRVIDAKRDYSDRLAVKHGEQIALEVQPSNRLPDG